MNLQGLTTKQVNQRIAEGKVNHTSDKTKNTIPKIILRNTLTIFNLVNLILALMIISVGAYKNLLFVLIAIANTLISIINEIRAKKTIDKLRILSEQQPTVIRNGEPRQIPADQIVEGDLLILSLGDQVIVDARIEEGTIEVNEAFITGEQENITKRKGDTLTSGSFIVSGTCKATATAVGKKNFINKLEQDAHSIKTANSKLFTIMNNIVKYISFALIPIGALVLWARFRVPDTTTTIAVTSTVAALINMIPEGLVLLTSSILALATIRLSRKKVLVQDLYSIETLARVDTIALDKTGTLTTGKMKVHELVPVKSHTENALENALMLILSAQDTDTATSAALRQKLPKTTKFEPTEQIKEIIPFSSDRKYSGVVTARATYLMGAAEILTDEKPDFDGSYRVIAVTKDKELLGYVLLEDEIRPTAKKIIQYFYDNDITPKIISGDDLNAVTTIAKKVGVKDLRGFELSSEKTHDYDQLVRDYAIFTRVTPTEKKHLIEALRKQGKTVAMTGDGVNDILAMKEADCSIAIGEGSDAARRSAKLVLLNSEFESVPSIIDEGRQSINNLERSTALFLAKTVYASILAVVFVFLPFNYPFTPIEMSLLNFTCIGFPGLVLSLEHNTDRIKNRFTRNILTYSFPIGLTVSICMAALSVISHLQGFSHPELTTISVLVTFTIDLILIYWISRPLNKLRASLLLTVIGIMVAAFAIPLIRDFFEFVFLTQNGLIVLVIVLAVGLLIFDIMCRLMHRLSDYIFNQRQMY